MEGDEGEEVKDCKNCHGELVQELSEEAGLRVEGKASEADGDHTHVTASNPPHWREGCGTSLLQCVTSPTQSDECSHEEGDIRDAVPPFLTQI